MGSGEFCEEVVKEVAPFVELGVPDEGVPALLDLGDADSGVVERLVTTVGRHDQLGASVSWVRDAVQVAEVRELVDELQRGREAQFRSGGEVGERDTALADVAPDLQIVSTDVAIPVFGHRFAEFSTELVQQASQQLTDHLAVGAQAA